MSPRDYARNYLLPRNLVAEASKGALAAASASRRKAAERRDAQTLAEAERSRSSFKTRSWR